MGRLLLGIGVPVERAPGSCCGQRGSAERLQTINFSEGRAHFRILGLKHGLRGRPVAYVVRHVLKESGKLVINQAVSSADDCLLVDRIGKANMRSGIVVACATVGSAGREADMGATHNIGKRAIAGDARRFPGGGARRRHLCAADVVLPVVGVESAEDRPR